MRDTWLFCRAFTAAVVFVFVSSLSYGDVGSGDSGGSTDSKAGKQNWWRFGNPGEDGDYRVKRSPSDDRAYRYLRLENGLQVLLISDPETDKAAASLNVNVGSFQNPQDRAGLAHFLEHMLFLGTDKYPEAGAYQKFISEHGGQHNAYTSLEDTNYFFDIDARHLFAALERFSRFFVAPRMDKAYVDRERNAVESEFRLKLKDDSRREWEVVSEQVVSHHPLSMFSVGDLETLADRENDPVRSDLLAFYKKYYSAEKMALVVLAREPLATLEKQVRDLFSAVPRGAGTKDPDLDNADGSSTATEHNNLLPKFTTPLPFQLSTQSLKDQRSLGITFPMASIEGDWRTKPDVYWGHLLGDESEGSLIAQLKKMGLANELSTGLAYDTKYGASFMVRFELTPEGIQQQAVVLDEFFAWLNLVRKQGLEKWRFSELASLLETQFRFSEKVAPASYVQHLSAGLRRYPPDEVLRGSHLLSDFDEQVLTNFVDQLTPENALITLLEPDVEDTDHVSARYGTPYRIDTVGKDTVGRWQQAMDGNLSLASTNAYLAEVYPLSGKGGERTQPVVLENKLNATVWHYADQQFGSPRGLFDARIATPAVSSCRNVAQSELYLALVRDALGEETYQAGLAGLSYKLYRWSNGIGLSIIGFTDRQSVLLDGVLQALVNSQWQQGDFTRLRNTLVRNFRNGRKEWPVRQLFAQLGPLIKGDCDNETLANELEQVSLKDIAAFRDELYSKGHVRFYAGGALSAEQSLAMAESTIRSLGVGEAGDLVLYDRVVSLPEQTQSRSIAVDHNDSSVVLYIQGDDDTLSERARMAMINMLIKAPFYTTMRTEKQLGYVVGTNIMHMNRVPGLGFYIQSPQSSSAELETEINQYLLAFESNLKAISGKEFEAIKAALLATIQEKPRNIIEQAARHQESLVLGYKHFQFRDKLVEQIVMLDQVSLLTAYQRLVKNGSRRLWVVTSETKTGSEPESVSAKGKLKADSKRVFAYPQ